jgi:hypothetical protein
MWRAAKSPPPVGNRKRALPRSLNKPGSAEMRTYNNRGVCRNCGQERALAGRSEQCLACCRDGDPPGRVVRRLPSTPSGRVVWPDESKTRGICVVCGVAVPLLDDGRTRYHKRGTAEHARRSRACAGSAVKPSAHTGPARRRVEVLDQPVRVDERVHHGRGGGVFPAGFHM